MIFTSNDILINAGVILAGLMVLWLDSSLPDLIIGAFVFVLVSLGAWRILKFGENKITTFSIAHRPNEAGIP